MRPFSYTVLYRLDFLTCILPLTCRILLVIFDHRSKITSDDVTKMYLLNCDCIHFLFLNVRSHSKKPHKKWNDHTLFYITNQYRHISHF